MNNPVCKRFYTIWTVLFLGLFFMTGCASGNTDSEQTQKSDAFTVLTIGTADSGGSMYPASSALSEAITRADSSLRFNIRASTGSVENVRALSDKSVDLALVSGDVALAAYEGTDMFSGDPFQELRAIAAVYISSSNWMVLEESPFYYVHDLAGTDVAVGPENSASERAASWIYKTDGFALENVTPINHGLSSGASLLLDGSVDAMHGFAGLPIPGMQTASAERACRLLLYTEEELRTILSSDAGYFATVTPAGTYPGQNKDVKTFGAKCLLCVHADMDEAFVYRLTDLLCACADELSAEPLLSSLGDSSFAFEELPVPLHEGTIQYLQKN